LGGRFGLRRRLHTFAERRAGSGAACRRRGIALTPYRERLAVSSCQRACGIGLERILQNNMPSTR
jgi:hypothetical protein